MMSVALSGLIVLQAILLKTALKTEEESFRQNVILALNNVVEDLIDNEARNAIMQISINDTTIDGNRGIIKKIGRFNTDVKDSIFFFHSDSIQEVDSMAFSYEFTIDQYVDDVDEVILGTKKENVNFALLIDDSLKIKASQNSFGFIGDSILFQDNFENKDSARVMIIQAALSQMELMEHIPIESRLDTLALDSAIFESLNRVNVDLNYSFAVTNRTIDSMIMQAHNPDLEVLSVSPYKAVLFPNDFIISNNYLILDFPNKQFFIYSKLLTLILPTLFFLLIIISIFIYAIKLILRQRKVSVRLTNFINNMTHEFKTPISTIQLASEAISKYESSENNEKLLSYNKMILSENKRMKNHVDKILQMATLEEGDYLLSLEKFNIHSLIDEVVDLFSMLLKQKKCEISMNLKATKFNVYGDRVHLLNIISNLIDNALKYSNDNPKLIVTTNSKNSHIEISIKDDGIGIHPDDLKFIFDKYYRVGKGDVHDIKGFGLGLSYVKMMVEAHKGSVRLVSALDKGTEVIISLPLNQLL